MRPRSCSPTRPRRKSSTSSCSPVNPSSAGNPNRSKSPKVSPTILTAVRRRSRMKRSAPTPKRARSCSGRSGGVAERGPRTRTAKAPRSTSCARRNCTASGARTASRGIQSRLLFRGCRFPYTTLIEVRPRPQIHCPVSQAAVLDPPAFALCVCVGSSLRVWLFVLFLLRNASSFLLCPMELALDSRSKLKREEH